MGVSGHGPMNRPTSDLPSRPSDSPPANVRVVDPVAFSPSPRDRVRAFLRAHGRKLWWLHSAYALGLGITVVAFAQKGFDHARWLAITIGAAWLLVVLFFRVFGSGRAQEQLHTAGTKARLRFFAMTYALKNLYQGMLFFLLPFYWKSTTFWTPNSWFVVLLGVCAFLSTLDIVFDRVVFRFRALAALFHGVALFGCLNLVVPALFPDTRTLYSLLIATGIGLHNFGEGLAIGQAVVDKAATHFLHRDLFLDARREVVASVGQIERDLCRRAAALEKNIQYMHLFLGKAKPRQFYLSQPADHKLGVVQQFPEPEIIYFCDLS